MRACRIIFVLTLMLYPLGTFAENIDPDDEGLHYAWGENVGWINFKPSSGSGVTVTDSAITGYAWGENIGWINLSPSDGEVVNDASGNLSGYGWGENVGWINFAPTGAGVVIDPTTGRFSGHAWGENTGWINFAPTEGGVKTSWVSEGDDDDDQHLWITCWVTLAAHGSHMAEEVSVLRAFRDDVLLNSSLGRDLVKLYYEVSPPIADYIARHEALRTAVRFGLAPVVYGVKYPRISGLILLCLVIGTVATLTARQNKHL
jgi:hypothetical protein